MSRLKVFIQARMTSSRFPGKVLAPLNGRPVLLHVAACMRRAGISDQDIVVLTSDELTDDPVAAYSVAFGLPVFRGSLQNVMRRFVDALELHQCEWVLRATADSPFYQPELIRFVAQAMADTPASFVTTTYRRTLPVGMNVEAVRASLLRETILLPSLTDYDREHLTSPFHRAIPAQGLCSIELEGADLSRSSLAIDSMEDFRERGENRSDQLLKAIPWGKLRAKLISP